MNNDLKNYGWAPGNYSFRCKDCTPKEAKPFEFPIGAKGAWRCERCAQKAVSYAPLQEKLITDDIVARLRNLHSYEEGVEELCENAADEIERLRKLNPTWHNINSIPHDRPVLVQTKHCVTIQVLPTPSGKFIEEWRGAEVNKHDFYAWREIITNDEIGELK